MSATYLTGSNGALDISLSGNITGPFTITPEKEGYLDLIVENVTVEVDGTYDLGMLTMVSEGGDTDGDADNTWPITIVILAIVVVAGVAVVLLRKK